jgi:antitoxin component YwqK of YwqJK toxin-antitoxin module
MTWWHENGNLMHEFYYDNNVEVGEWKYYKSDGTLEFTEVYENGDLIKTINE